MTTLLLSVLGIACFALAFLSWKFWQDARELRGRYSRIIDAEAAAKATREKSEAEARSAAERLENLRREQREIESSNGQRRSQLDRDYGEALAHYKSLQAEVKLLEENLEDISFGVYQPHFTFSTSEEYKTKLQELRDRERQLIHDNKAAICPVSWSVGGSDKEGQRMVKQNTKLLLRAFNGECDGAIANVSWNNVTKMEERMRHSFDGVNQLGGVLHSSITQEYLSLKLDEVRLTHEAEEKRHQEREEQRKIREQIREEEKVQREIETAKKDAEEEEARYQKALEKAREEAAQATGAQLQKLTEQIESFESKLDEARRTKERAVSRAQLTKSGFVYVISNPGSFGDNICKIGMTRRLEPQERIDELGDASVPFPFDVHAMLYSDNAPELEAALHGLVNDRSVNLVNPRKEFYADVELSEIEAFVRARGLSAQFIRVAEAKQYRQTLALRQQRRAPEPEKRKEFPDRLFEGPGSS